MVLAQHDKTVFKTRCFYNLLVKICTPRSPRWSKLWEPCKIFLDEWFHRRWQVYSFEPVEHKYAYNWSSQTHCKAPKSSRPVHFTSEEFENGGFTLKTHRMLSVHIMPEILRTQQFIPVNVFRRRVSVPTKAQSRRFHIRPVWRSFYETIRLRDGLVWMVGLTVKLKLRFEI